MRISVVVPSYNRAHLLKRTLPTYINQEDVIELILVDDCSTDDTEKVVKELQNEYPQIRYFRNQKNSKQPYSNNVGILNAVGDYIYFGDDDSILMPDSIHYLKETILKYNVQICGAKALFLPDGYNGSEYDYIREMDVPCPEGEKIVDIGKLSAKFIYSVSEPVTVPFCHASAIVKTDLARKVMFDTGYTGNAYREETDFFVRCSFQGARIMYDSRAVQLNLPRRTAHGGAHSGGRLKWYMSAVRNNWYFLDKNWDFLRKKYNVTRGKYMVQACFVCDLFVAGARNFMNIIFHRRHD